MVRRRLKHRGAEAARSFGMLFFAVSFAVLAGCNGVPNEGAGVTDRIPVENKTPTEQASQYLSTSSPGSRRYLVGPQDMLDISVYGAPDLSKTMQVGEDGTINMPLIGQIPAAGKSPSELERNIQSRLNARYLRAAQVTVVVREYNSQRVTVQGAVKSPGVHKMQGEETLMQVLARSGGVDSAVASSDVVLFRTANGARTMTRYDISAIIGGTAPDPAIAPGDVVVVSDSMAKMGLNNVLKVLPLAGLAMAL
jgi:polysaccharide export outer membrane protein